MRRGTNVQALRGFNQTVILDTVRRARDGLSRVEIAQQTGLSPQTVSNVSRRLLDSGVIVEGGQLINGVGKPRTILHLEPSGCFAIGVHIDPAVITYVILDLSGRVIARASRRTPPEESPDRAIDGMRDAIESLIVESAVPRDRILGVGIAAPGPVDLDRGMVLHPPLLEGWQVVALREALAEATGFLVLLEKDVTAAAVAELWMSAGDESDDFMFFYYGTGVGVGLALGHEVVRGSTKNAGDAGHIMVDPDGPVCSSCGRKGCLGDSIMPIRLVDRAIAEGVLGPVPGRSRADDGLVQLSRLARSGDPRAVLIIERTASRMAAAVVTIANLLDVQRVVFGGPYWTPLAGVLLPRLPELINSSDALETTHGVAVVESAAGDDVAAIGAACLVLDNVLSPRPSALLI
jgi:predicted NBD/HSP70 family sugar kinase